MDNVIVDAAHQTGFRFTGDPIPLKLEGYGLQSVQGQIGKIDYIRFGFFRERLHKQGKRSDCHRVR